MSLVGDALRKARQEAALRDARQLGSNPLPPLARPVRRSRLGVGLMVGLLAGAAVAISGGAAVWWAVGRSAVTTDTATPRTELAASTAPGPAAVIPSPSAPVNGAITTPSERIAVASASGTAAAQPVAPASPRDDGAPDQAPQAEAPGRPGNGPAVAPLPRPTATPVSHDWTGTREFVLEADLGDARLSLGYIVFRGTDPFAEVNGREVHIGSQVEGFTVVSIEADRVTLRGLHRTVVLRAR